MTSNLSRLTAALAQSDVPALLVSDNVNVGWLTGFTGSFGAAVVTPTGGVFVTDSRYTLQAGQEVQGLEVRSFSNPKKFTDVLGEVVRDLGVKRLAFEPSVTYATWNDWKSALPDVEWVPNGELLKPLRMVKSADEVAKVREACKLADACVAHVVRMLQPGVAEYDIGLDIEFFLRRNGAEVGFSPIVASGPNSARPHARPTDRKLESGDFVTLDLGARLDGYCSDITRTFVIGKASDRHREVYDQVLKAEQSCVQALKPGVPCKDVDALARTILDEKGLAKHFGHGLGHGLGRAVHDLGSLSPSSSDTVTAGQVWTVEPGVYIEGFGGVRIEDDVHVTPDGPETLTASPRELIELS
jgi:Xaa-Pro aminopeptidase